MAPVKMSHGSCLLQVFLFASLLHLFSYVHEMPVKARMGGSGCLDFSAYYEPFTPVIYWRSAPARYQPQGCQVKVGR